MSGDEEQQVSAGGYLLSEDNLARRIKYEMDQRGWSQERMAKEMTDAGYPIHQTSVGKIVSPGRGKRRAISVDDALGFAKVLGVPLVDLLSPVETALEERLRPVLQRLLDLAQQHDDLEREMSGLVHEMLQITRELDWSRIEEIYGRGNAGRVHTFVDELQRWGHRAIREAGKVPEDLSDEEALVRLRRIIRGDTSDEAPQ